MEKNSQFIINQNRKKSKNTDRTCKQSQRFVTIQMTLSLEYSIYNELNSIIKVISQNSILRLSIIFSQLASIIILFLIKKENEFLNFINPLKQLISKLNQNVLTDHIANFGSIAACVSSVTFILFFLLKVCYVETFRPFQKIKYFRLLNILRIGLITIWACVELGFYFLCWCLMRSYVNHGMLSFIMRSLAFFITYIYINKMFKTPSLYQFITPKIGMLLVMLNTKFLTVIIIVVSAYFIHTKGSKIQKLTLTIISLISLIFFRNQIFLINQSTQSFTVLIMTTLMALIICVLAYFVGDDIRFQKDKISHQKNCINILKNANYEKIELGIQIKDMIKLYTEMNSIFQVQQIRQANQLSDQIPSKVQILDKPFEEFTIQDYCTVIESCLISKLSRSSLSINNQTQARAIILQIVISINPNSKVQMHRTISQIYALIASREKVTKSSIKSKVYDLFDETKKMFLRAENGIYEVERVLDLAKLKDEKYLKEMQLIDQIRSFWQMMTIPQTHRNLIDSSTKKILKLQAQINYAHQTLKFAEKCQPIHPKIRQILNPYSPAQSIQESYSFQDLFLQSSSSSQYLYRRTHNFILFEQSGKIIDISQKIMKKLCASNHKSSVKELLLTELIGCEQFFQIVKNQIAKLKPMKQNEQQDQFILPICAKNGVVQLMNATLLWYPTLSQAPSYLLVFSDKQELPRQPFILYNLKLDSITFFSHKFLQQYCPNNEFFFGKQSINIEFNQIFSNLSSAPSTPSQFKTLLEQQKPISCKINLQKFFGCQKRAEYKKKGNSHLVNVDISSVFTLPISQNDSFYVIKVTRQNQSTQRQFPYSSLQISSSYGAQYTSQMIQQDHNQITLKNTYRDQKFYCKIPNPYESKINEKLSQIQEPRRFKCIYIVYLISLAMASLMIYNGVLDSQLAAKRSQLYKKVDVDLNNVSESYALIYQCYTAALKKYEFNSYPEWLFQAMVFSKQMLLDFYRDLIQGFIDQIMARYLQQLRPPFLLPTIEYNLIFQSFEVKTDTKKSTLMDFVEHIKSNQLSEEIDFLLTNYDSFRELTLKHEELLAKQDLVSDIIKNDSWVSWIIAGALAIGITAGLIIVIIVENVINDVYKLIEIVQLAKWGQTASKVQSVLGQLCGQNSSEKGTNLNTIQKRQSSISISQSSQSSKKKEQQGSSLTLKSHQNSIVTSSQSLSIRKSPLAHTPTNHKLTETLITKYQRILPFAISLLIIFGVAVNDYLSFVIEKQGMQQVFGIKTALYRALLQIKRQQVDPRINPIVGHYFGENSSFKNNYFDKSQIRLFDEIPQTNIRFQVMDKFVKNTYRALSGNLCDIPMKYPVEFIPCDRYMNGLLTKGINQVLDKHIQNGKIVSNLKLYQFISRPCTIEDGCPPSTEQQYVSIKLGETLRYFLELFNQEMKNVYSYLEENKYIKMTNKFICLLGFVIGFFIWNYWFGKRTKMVLGLFLMLPKQIMTDAKVVRYIKMNKLLDRIQYI